MPRDRDDDPFLPEGAPPDDNQAAGAQAPIPADYRSGGADQVSAAAIEEGIVVSDVDRPVEAPRRDDAVDPWASRTPGMGVEGKAAMEVLSDLRRTTHRFDAIEPPGCGLLYWLVAAVVVGLLGVGILAFFR